MTGVSLGKSFLVWCCVSGPIWPCDISLAHESCTKYRPMTHDSHVPYQTNSQALTINFSTGNLRRTDFVLSVRVCFARNCGRMKLSMSSGVEISGCRCLSSWCYSSKPYRVFFARTRIVVVRKKETNVVVNPGRICLQSWITCEPDDFE